MVTTWLKLLPMELAEIKDIIEPENEVQPGDTELGVMDKDLRKLYTYRRVVSASLQEMAANHKREAILGKSSDLSDLCRQKFICEAIDNIFWLALNDTFDAWEWDVTAIRKGFKVVGYNKPPEPDLGSLLKGLLL